MELPDHPTIGSAQFLGIRVFGDTQNLVVSSNLRHSSSSVGGNFGLAIALGGIVSSTARQRKRLFESEFSQALDSEARGYKFDSCCGYSRSILRSATLQRTSRPSSRHVASCAIGLRVLIGCKSGQTLAQPRKWNDTHAHTRKKESTTVSTFFEAGFAGSGASAWRRLPSRFLLNRPTLFSASTYSCLELNFVNSRAKCAESRRRTCSRWRSATH